MLRRRVSGSSYSIVGRDQLFFNPGLLSPWPFATVADRDLTNNPQADKTGELIMNLEKVFFAFFIVLALTLNFGFFLGDLDDPNHHNIYELFAALVVSLIATIMKFGDRAHIGAVLLATSLVADLQLIAAAVIWTLSVHATDTGLTPMIMASIVSLSGGALLANITSVIILVTETVMFRR
jgi:Ca2+/H+ antiporter, TMEM165/GDT1 family